MKEERNIITMDGQGNISLPSDIGATAMTEREICELFGVIAPTVTLSAYRTNTARRFTTSKR